MHELDTDRRGDAFGDFWAERHLCVLATVRADGTVHQVPVGVTYDAETATARIITDGASAKVRFAEAAARVSVCQVDGARWSTLEGVATVNRSPEAVREAVRRYALRYRVPRVNPNRVVIEIAVDRILGTSRPASAGEGAAETS